MDISTQEKQEALWTSSFICACLSNLLLFFAFYLILPILPLYLIEEFHTSKSLAGIILSCYILAALVSRPISGFILDIFRRRPIYIVAYFIFVILFIGYPLGASVTAFLIIRILHGLSFGTVTTSGNSLIVDIMPASRRGEGLGYFGVANTLAMAFGPMISLLMHGNFSYTTIFGVGISSGLIGFIIVLGIKSPKLLAKTPGRQPIAFDRFFLTKGIPAGICLAGLGIPYGMLTTYIALYGQELHIPSGSGYFFSLMAVGMVLARLTGGKLVDRGKLSQVISWGTIACLIGFLSLAALHNVKIPWMCNLIFYLIAIALGIGYGLIFPAYNTLFVNLAPHNRRATASSTYMTTWDIGVGSGLIWGGQLADSKAGLPMAYLVGSIAVAVSLIFFVRIATPHFNRHKLQ